MMYDKHYAYAYIPIQDKNRIKLTYLLKLNHTQQF